MNTVELAHNYLSMNAAESGADEIIRGLLRVIESQRKPLNLNKDIERWAKVRPDAFLTGSIVQAHNVIEMALQDIAVLAAENQQTEYVIKQHLGWLKSYVEGMNENNWRDMKLRCERQLDQLSKEAFL